MTKVRGLENEFPVFNDLDRSVPATGEGADEDFARITPTSAPKAFDSTVMTSSGKRENGFVEKESSLNEVENEISKRVSPLKRSEKDVTENLKRSENGVTDSLKRSENGVIKSLKNNEVINPGVNVRVSKTDLQPSRDARDSSAIWKKSDSVHGDKSNTDPGLPSPSDNIKTVKPTLVSPSSPKKVDFAFSPLRLPSYDLQSSPRPSSSSAADLQPSREPSTAAQSDLFAGPKVRSLQTDGDPTGPKSPLFVNSVSSAGQVVHSDDPKSSARLGSGASGPKDALFPLRIQRDAAQEAEASDFSPKPRDTERNGRSAIRPINGLTTFDLKPPGKPVSDDKLSNGIAPAVQGRILSADELLRNQIEKNRKPRMGILLEGGAVDDVQCEEGGQKEKEPEVSLRRQNRTWPNCNPLTDQATANNRQQKNKAKSVTLLGKKSKSDNNNFAEESKSDSVPETETRVDVPFQRTSSLTEGNSTVGKKFGGRSCSAENPRTYPHGLRYSDWDYETSSPISSEKKAEVGLTLPPSGDVVLNAEDEDLVKLAMSTDLVPAVRRLSCVSDTVLITKQMASKQIAMSISEVYTQKPDTIQNSHSVGCLDHGAQPSRENVRQSPGIPRSLCSLSLLQEKAENDRRGSMASEHSIQDSIKSTLKGVLKIVRRGSKETSSPGHTPSTTPPRSPGLHKASIFNDMLKRVSIHRKDSSPVGRIATFIVGSEGTEDANDENGTAGKKKKAGEDGKPVVLRQTERSKILNSLFMILSGLYGILIVVLGSVIPLTEIFVDEERAAFEYFYLYLYLISIIFLVYVYLYLLRRNRLRTEFLARKLSRSMSFASSFANSLLRQNSDKGRTRKRMVSLDESNHHTGTFYLRLGVLGFGIGSMIHSGLNFGKFFGSITEGVCAGSGIPLLLKPLLHLIFTFSQLYFIFMNSKMCIHRYKVVARFGLMHMAATNICVWFRSIVVETLHEIHHHDDEHDLHHNGHHLPHGGGSHAADHVSTGKASVPHNVKSAVENVTLTLGRKLLAAVADSAVNESEEEPKGGLLELRCSWNNMMGKAVDSAGPYLYPCTIEYSLMCAGILYVMWCVFSGILYVMWNNVGTRPRRRTDSELEDVEEDMKHQRMSVDCTSSSRGLFLGIFLTVCAIIGIIAFYVMVNQSHLNNEALLLTHLAETIIYIVTIFALVMASLKMQHLLFHPDHKSDLEETLIIIAYTGLLAFNIFSLVAAILLSSSEGAALTIVSNFTMMLQAAFQTIFMLAGDRLSAANIIQERKKPGREYVTFLLLCNFAMWVINTFMTQKPEHNPLQVEFYGPEAWSIFSHISVPLGIYYRFHSTVCLSNIWKNAWKFRKHH